MDRRRRALALLDTGLSMHEVGRRLGCAPSSVMRWSHAREEHGDSGLEVRFSPGRPIRLKQSDRKKLLRMLTLGARRHGYDDDYWTGARIADLIKLEFRVDYHRNHINRILRRMGWEFRPPNVWCPVEAP